MTSTRRRLLAPPPPYVLDRPPVPTFSVVIPSYEAASFVAGAIESALAQTVAAHEVIVSDDGSTDDLDEALRPYGSRIRLVRGAHAGPAAARNRALRVATGDFVAALDADDAYQPERLEALAWLAQERPDLDILGTDASLEVGGAVVGRFNASTPFPVTGQREAAFRSCFLAAPAARRSRLLAVGGYDERLRAGEDWDMLLRLLLAGCAAGLVDEPLYTYRLRPDSITSGRVAALRSRVQLLEQTRGHPGLSPNESTLLEREVVRNRCRLLRAEAETAALEGGRDRRRRALRLASARGVRLRERGWAMRVATGSAHVSGTDPTALESAPPWRRIGG